MRRRQFFRAAGAAALAAGFGSGAHLIRTEDSVHLAFRPRTSMLQCNNIVKDARHALSLTFPAHDSKYELIITLTRDEGAARNRINQQAMVSLRTRQRNPARLQRAIRSDIQRMEICGTCDRRSGPVLHVGKIKCRAKPTGELGHIVVRPKVHEE